MIEVSILGPLEVRRDGEVVPVPGGKPRALLLALVVRANEPVSQDRLIETLWGDEPPPRAGPNLHVHVATLRKLLNGDPGAAIETSGGGYRLRIDADRIDARRFERLVAEARGGDDAADRLRRALELWRGPALAEVADEPFAHTEALRLEEARLAALEKRIDADLALGRHRELVPELEALVGANPLRERPSGQLMQALYASGRQAEALAVYRDLRRRLVDELGIEPSPELHELERAILRQDESLSPEAPSVAPRRKRRRYVLLSTAAVVALVGGIAALVAATRGSGGGVRAAAPQVIENSIVEIDPASGRVRSVIAVGNGPGPVVATPRALWVVNRGDRTVSRIDRHSRAVRTVGGASFAYDMAADAHENVWVSGGGVPFVTRISGGTARFPYPARAPATVRVARNAGALAVGGGFLWVASGDFVSASNGAFSWRFGTGRLTRVELSGRHRTSLIRTATEVPFSVAYSFGAVWIGEYDEPHAADVVSTLRTGSESLRTVVVGRHDAGPPLDIADGAGSVWVLTFGGHVVRLDPDSGRVLARISLGHDVEALSLAAGAGSVWVTERADFSVARIDPRTNRVVKKVSVGRVGAFPCYVATTPHAIWVTIGSDTNCGGGGESR
jgi:DNA-binding SARP family transcriptional activator/streptogramin lyase